MKDINLPLDNNTQSLEELTKEANNIIEFFRGRKRLKIQLILQELLELNIIIEKKFNKTTKIINEETKKKINIITSKKNEK